MVSIVMVTENGEEHGLIKELPNSCPDKGNPNMAPELKKDYELKRKHDAKIVKARYINHRGMHERLDKVYLRYAGDPIRQYHLIPGKVYDLPMGFIEDVNGNPGLPNRKDKIVDGQVTTKDSSPTRVHELVPISW